MTEAILLLVIVALTGLIGWFDWNNRKERKSLLNAILAKDVNELSQLDLVDNIKIEVPKEEDSDLISSSEVSDEKFRELIDEELKEE